MRLVKKPDAEVEIRSCLMPYYRRIKKKDLGLPTPNFNILRVNAKPLQRKIYNTIARGILRYPGFGTTERSYIRMIRKARLVRLMQAASNPELIASKSDEFHIPSLGKDANVKKIDNLIAKFLENYSKHEVPAKIDTAEKLTRSLTSSGKKVLIWTTWIRNIELLKKKLHDLNPVTIHGDVPINENQDQLDNREIRINNFKINSEVAVMIANPGACGESISLHDVCHDAIYLDRTFNGAQYMQSLDRIHRVGLTQKDKINYYLIRTKNTIDDTIHNRLNEKISRMQEILRDDFKPLDLESSLEEVSDIEQDEDEDYEITIQDLRRLSL
jgi:SNF2 family DNA or RNA helicase